MVMCPEVFTWGDGNDLSLVSMKLKCNFTTFLIKLIIIQKLKHDTVQW
jgi:hypothetical protein